MGSILRASAREAEITMANNQLIADEYTRLSRAENGRTKVDSISQK
jgi:hypothetical protein